MNVRCFTIVAAVGAVSLLGGCGGGDATVLELRVENGAAALDPQYLMLDWLDGTHFLNRAQRVPSEGSLSAGSPLARVRIELAGRGDGIRRAVVRGYVGEDVVSEGTTRVELPDAVRINALVTLLPGRRLDTDMDGVPDDIDGCPFDHDINGPCPGGGVAAGADGITDDGGPPPPDVGIEPAEAGVDNPRDAGADADLAADRPPADAAPDVVRDAGAEASVDVPINAPTPFACGMSLLVTSDQNAPPDRPLVDRLTRLGCTVVQVTDGTITAAAAAGKSVVVVSDTVNGSTVKTTLRTVATPIVVMRPDLLDDHGLTGSTDGTDWARNSTEQFTDIVDPTHPMAAGLSGRIAFSQVPFAIGWGRPEPTAIRIGALVGNPARCLLFGYEAGALMNGGFAAPARRVAYPVHSDGTPKLNGNGWLLFDAAVRWATGL